MERGPEPERVGVVDHPAAPVLDDPAAGRAAVERLGDRDRVEAGLHREDHALRRAEVGAGEHDLVDGLDRLPAARGPEVGDRLAHRLEDRPRPLRVLGLAADEDRQGRVLRALRAAGDRRVHEADAALAEAAGELGGGAGRDRRAVDDEAALAQALRDAVGAEQARPRRPACPTRRPRRRPPRAPPRPALAATLPPSPARSSPRPALRFQPVTSKPARRRFAAIAAPIVPSPTNAIRSTRVPPPCRRVSVPAAGAAYHRDRGLAGDRAAPPGHRDARVRARGPRHRRDRGRAP